MDLDPNGWRPEGPVECEIALKLGTLFDRSSGPKRGSVGSRTRYCAGSL